MLPSTSLYSPFQRPFLQENCFCFRKSLTPQGKINLQHPLRINIASNVLQLKETEGCSTLHPLLSNPREIAIGGVWIFFLFVGSVSSVESLRELYHTFTIESSTSNRFEKIGAVVKKVFVDLVDLGGTCAYTIHWTHEAQLFSLGAYAPFVKGLGLGSSWIVNSIESGVSLYHIYREREAMLAERSIEGQEKHKQRCYFSLMKLIASTTMVAWTTLGICSMTLGMVFSPVFMTLLLGVSCLFSLAAYFYAWELGNYSICRL